MSANKDYGLSRRSLSVSFDPDADVNVIRQSPEGARVLLLTSAGTLFGKVTPAGVEGSFNGRAVSFDWDGADGDVSLEKVYEFRAWADTANGDWQLRWVNGAGASTLEVSEAGSGDSVFVRPNSYLLTDGQGRQSTLEVFQPGRYGNLEFFDEVFTSKEGE